MTQLKYLYPYERSPEISDRPFPENSMIYNFVYVSILHTLLIKTSRKVSLKVCIFFENTNLSNQSDYETSETSCSKFLDYILCEN